jgi:hypothetical protein
VTRPALLRAGKWASLGLCLLLGAAITTALARPTFWQVNAGTVAGLSAGRVEIGRSSGALTRQSIAWGLQNPYGFSSIITGPNSLWRPSTASASMAVSYGGPPVSTQTLRVLYIPLWPWLFLSSASTFILYRLARRRNLPGHCPHCTYDLRGLHSPRCPECGKPTESLAKRLAAVLSPRRHPRLT